MRLLWPGRTSWFINMNGTDYKLVGFGTALSALALGYLNKTGRGMLGLDNKNAKTLMGALTVIGSGILVQCVVRKVKV